MSEMVERVIAAMVATECDCASWARGPLEEIARAAIAAMREPTKAMLKASGAEGLLEEDHVEMTWDSMIDAALK